MGNLYNQKQYAVLYKNRSSRRIHTKIELYNERDVQVDSLEGVVLSGSVELNGDSTFRRNAKITTKLIKELLPQKDGKIWFDKRVKILIGLEDWDETVIWYDLGKFAIENIGASKDQSSKSMDINLLDYMAFLDGTLGGYLSNETVIPSGQGIKISEAIAATVRQLPRKIVDSLQIDGLDALIPYDLEFSPNATIHDMTKELVEMYMSQEFYFDLNGVFRVQTIKDRRYDPIKWDFTEDNMDLSIDYSNDMQLSNVKNSIHIWGATNESTGIQTYWVYRNRWARNTKAELSSLVDKQKGDICHIKNEGNSYAWNGSSWELLEFRVASDFNIENIGEKVWTYSDDKIFDENQAKLRCEYELLQYNHFAETVSFTCVPIYLLDVNSKIKLFDRDTGIDGDYLITSISVPLNIDGSMSINARKIYY